MSDSDPLGPAQPGTSRYRRLTEATQEQQRLQDFAAALSAEADTACVILYLTHLTYDRGFNGRQIRDRLRALDLAARRAGLSPPSTDPRVTTFLRGLHTQLPLGPVLERPPLYSEDVAAMLDAIDADQLPQIRDAATIYLANATRLPISSLARLTWNDIRFRRDRLILDISRRPGHRHYGPAGQVTVPLAHYPATCAALRRLQTLTGPHGGFVLARGPNGPRGAGLLSDLIRPALGVRDTWSRASAVALSEEALLPAVARRLVTLPRQARDKALIILTFTACLDADEATALRCGDVVETALGLLITVSTRAHPVAVPAVAGRHDPPTLWKQWLAHLSSAGCAGPDAPAFPPIIRDAVQPRGPLKRAALSRIITERAVAAGLPGDYTFSSLRMGFLRSAARAGVPGDLVAHQAGLRHLDSYAIHQRRELLIRDSVLQRVGL